MVFPQFLQVLLEHLEPTNDQGIKVSEVKARSAAVSTLPPELGASMKVALPLAHLATVARARREPGSSRPPRLRLARIRALKRAILLLQVTGGRSSTVLSHLMESSAPRSLPFPLSYQRVRPYFLVGEKALGGTPIHPSAPSSRHGGAPRDAACHVMTLPQILQQGN